jgi:hypothetical protein
VGYEKAIRKGERKKAMYRLTLDRDDIRALDFIGNRYSIGLDLYNLLINAYITYEDQEDPDMGFTVELTECEAWQVIEFLNDDTEDLRTNHPLLSSSSNLWNGLINLYNSVV